MDGSQKSVVNVVDYWKVIQSKDRSEIQKITSPLKTQGAPLSPKLMSHSFQFTLFAVSKDLVTIVLGEISGVLLQVNLDEYYKIFPSHLRKSPAVSYKIFTASSKLSGSAANSMKTYEALNLHPYTQAQKVDILIAKESYPSIWSDKSKY